MEMNALNWIVKDCTLFKRWSYQCHLLRVNALNLIVNGFGVFNSWSSSHVKCFFYSVTCYNTDSLTSPHTHSLHTVDMCSAQRRHFHNVCSDL